MSSSRRLAIVEEIWRRFEERGLAAATEALWHHATDDIVLAPVLAGGMPIAGRDKLRELLAEQRDTGVEMSARAFSFEEEDDVVRVSCSLRVREGEAHLSDSQTTLVYRFRGDRICAAGREDPSP